MNPVPVPGLELRGYPVCLRRVELGDVAIELLGPANYESLLDDPRTRERFARNEYMPYWAELWPASLLLAAEVAGWPVGGDGAPHVLELGCGLGLVSLVALARGLTVVAADYDGDTLAFVRESARRSGLPEPATRLLDWREHYADLRPDRILAADVLYETRNLRPVAEFVAAHLAPDGEAWISDANRSTADDFMTVARHCGLSGAESPLSLTMAGQTTRGRLFRLRLR
jgi:2-polyprenyl-3-methyl-5-hydroxy-6-metoxy-1,4-benzoquinol methylase